TRGTVGRAAARRTSPVPPPEHELILYEYEASPWCRIVREYLTILDLKVQIRPCPRQTLFMEGAYNKESRFRPEAMQYLKSSSSSHPTEDMTFPILVDCTKSKDSPEIPYLSVAAGTNSANSDPLHGHSIPMLKDGTKSFYGARECNDHLWNAYKDPNGLVPRYWKMLSAVENLGRAGSWGVGAYTAFLKGSRDFVPKQAMK
ncbi:MAG: hypothetical protein SGBAC_013411, partial [Bacillariaceae sp.]